MAVRKEQPISYQEWLDFESNLGETRRAELIDGQIYMMSAPSSRHQAVSGNLYFQLRSHLRGKKCRVFYSPFAVRLNEDSEVQPDLVVICDPKKITPRGCSGVPDLIIEILSPATARHDRHTKFMLYLEAGVPEYWIVDPENNAITAYRLTDNGYNATVFTDTDTATIAALPDFEMNLSAVFEE